MLVKTLSECHNRGLKAGLDTRHSTDDTTIREAQGLKREMKELIKGNPKILLTVCSDSKKRVILQGGLGRSQKKHFRPQR